MKNRKLIHSFSVTSINRIFSSILGFIRDMIFASLFGSTRSYDAFIIASHIPSFITYLITEAGLTQIFTPLLSEKQITTNTHQLRQFIANIFGALLTVLLLLVILCTLFSSQIISLFAPGFSEENRHLAIFLFQMLTISILFSGVSGYQSAILNTFGNYGPPAFMPIIFNLCMIGAAIFLTKFFNISVYALASGIITSSILQVLFLSHPLFQKKLLVNPSFQCKSLNILKLIKLLLPALLGVSVLQAGVMIDFIFGSYLPTGSITWLYYSTRIMLLPVTLFAIGISTVSLPHLGRSHASNNQDHFQYLLEWSIRLALITSIPASIGLFFLANPIILTLFNHGQFTAYDALMTAKSTQAFSIGVLGFTLTKVCATGFYARQNISLPAKIAGITVLINVIFNFILVPKLLHTGLALSTSLSSLINATILFSLLLKKKYFRLNLDFFYALAKVICASTAMIASIITLTPTLNLWIHSTLSWRIEHLSFIFTSAILTYLVMLRVFGFEFRSILAVRSITQELPQTNPSDLPSPESYQSSPQYHTSEIIRKPI